MTFRVLLAPQFQQKGRHSGENGLGAMHLGVAGGAERDHHVEAGHPGNAVVHDERTLGPPRGATDPAAMAIAPQDRLAQTAEVGLILTPQLVTNGAHTSRQHPIATAAAISERCRLRVSFEVEGREHIPFQNTSEKAEATALQAR